MIVAVCVAGSMNDTSRTNASSDPPNSCCGREGRNSVRRTRLTRWHKGAYLDYPHRCLLFAPQYPFRTDYTSIWVHGAVHNVDGHYVTAVLVGVLMPHPDDDVGPGVTARAHIVGGRKKHGLTSTDEQQGGRGGRIVSPGLASHGRKDKPNSLVIEQLREVVHFDCVVESRGV